MMMMDDDDDDDDEGTLVALLPDAWSCGVRCRTFWTSVSML